MRFQAIAIAVIFAFTALPVLAADAPTIVTPDKVNWQSGTGPYAGAQIAVVSGDPTKPGEYVMRIRMPDGLKFGPHFHGGIENVTVLQGTLLVGLGDVMDPTKMLALPAGSFVSVPMGLHHFAMAKGDTILQIHGMGPESMTPVSTH